MSRTFDYHFTVVVRVEVDDDGKIIRVLDPYADDCLPPDSDTMVYDDDEDEWTKGSTADYDSNGIWFGNGWSAAGSVVEDALGKFANRPLPLCICCNVPIPEGEMTHICFADPCCADCWHEGLDDQRQTLCEQCGKSLIK